MCLNLSINSLKRLEFSQYGHPLWGKKFYLQVSMGNKCVGYREVFKRQLFWILEREDTIKLSLTQFFIY